MRNELWFRGLVAQSSVERAAAQLADFFRDRSPKPAIKVTDQGHLLLSLVGFSVVLRPEEDGSYTVLEVNDKFSPRDIESYEFNVGQDVPLANVARFVHDYTEAEQWEKL